jgi:hypothetical protein
MSYSVYPSTSGGLTTSDLYIKWTQLDTKTANNTSTSLTFSSIPATYDRLKIVYSGLYHNGVPSGNAALTLVVNGSTTALDYLRNTIPSLGTLSDTITAVSNNFVDILDYAVSVNSKQIISAQGLTTSLGYLKTTVISSLSVTCTQTLVSGTATLWGGKY